MRQYTNGGLPANGNGSSAAELLRAAHTRESATSLYLLRHVERLSRELGQADIALEDLSNRMRALEERLSALESGSAAPPTPSARRDTPALPSLEPPRLTEQAAPIGLVRLLSRLEKLGQEVGRAETELEIEPGADVQLPGEPLAAEKPAVEPHDTVAAAPAAEAEAEPADVAAGPVGTTPDDVSAEVLFALEVAHPHSAEVPAEVAPPGDAHSTPEHVPSNLPDEAEGATSVEQHGFVEGVAEAAQLEASTAVRATEGITADGGEAELAQPEAVTEDPGVDAHDATLAEAEPASVAAALGDTRERPATTTETPIVRIVYPRVGPVLALPAASLPDTDDSHALFAETAAPPARATVRHLVPGVAPGDVGPPLQIPASEVFAPSEAHRAFPVRVEEDEAPAEPTVVARPRRRRRRVLLAAILVIALVLAIALAIALSGGDNDAPQARAAAPTAVGSVPAANATLEPLVEGSTRVPGVYALIASATAGSTGASVLIGATRSDVDRLLGPAATHNGAGVVSYLDGSADLTFSSAGRVVRVQFNLAGASDELTPEAADSILARYRPSDAEEISRVAPQTGVERRIYRSASLASVFDGADTAGRDAGLYLEELHSDAATGRITTLIIALGATP